MSQPIGGALAFMGVAGACRCCTARRAARPSAWCCSCGISSEAIPLQTTAMSEVATVLGGFENVEQAILNIAQATKPEIIGICSTGVTETKGDDVEGYIRLIRDETSANSRTLPMVYVSTPDFKDAFQDGWEKTVTRMVEVLVETPTPRRRARSAIGSTCCRAAT